MWYKKNASILVEKLSFKKNRKDSCLFYKKDKNRQIIICFCVENSAMMGEDADLSKTKEDLNKYFIITVE